MVNLALQEFSSDDSTCRRSSYERKLSLDPSQAWRVQQHSASGAHARPCWARGTITAFRCRQVVHHPLPYRVMGHITPRTQGALLLIVASLLVSIIIYAPPWLIASWKGQVGPKDVAKLESDARTAIIQALGGAAVLLGLYFTAKTWRTTQEGQITDRFTKAINQLVETGPEKLAIRLGGIYALERIARDSERDHWPIMEILTAYVREHSPWKEEEEGPQEEISPSERLLKSTAVPIGGGLLLTRKNTTRPELAATFKLF